MIRMRRRNIVGGGAFALTLLALVCIPRHLPLSASTPTPVPANFHARLDQRSLTLRGTLPDSATKDLVLRRAHNVYDKVEIRIVDQLTVDQRTSSARWLTALPSILPVFGQLNGRGSVMIDGRSLVISGQVSSEQDKGTLLRNISPMTATGLVLEDHVATIIPTPSAISLQKKLNTVLSRHPIDFESNKATLTDRGLDALTYLLPLLRESPQAVIEIGGHTDSFGAPDYNKELSRLRADAVRKFLVKQGLPHRFTIKGYGASRPLSTELNRAALRQNRRIELRVQQEGRS